MPFALPCVIFAGGKSSRMGSDKALLPFGGFSTLAEYQYRRLLPLFPNLFISTKRDKFPFKAPLIFDEEGDETFAPTAGLMAVFAQLQSDFFVVSVDTPFVEEDVIEKLMRVYLVEKPAAVVAKSPSGIHPLCGIYTTQVASYLETMILEGEYRLTHLLQVVDTAFVMFEKNRPFYNINTPEEYKMALSGR